MSDFLKLAEDYSVATDEVEIVLGEPLREHTSFRLGGSARFFAKPYSEEALAIGLKLCLREDLPVYILGRGTNLLVSDRGVYGAVFDLTGLDGIRAEGTKITAQAGALLRNIAKAAAEASLTGLEFAHGIPGSLGGAVVMNAGAFGPEMKDVVESVRVMDRYGQIREIPAAGMDFGYRHSRLEESGEIVLSAVLALEPGEKAAIEAKMRELGDKRREKQPLNTRNAGSTFKRPAGHFAGRLIEDAGLKGFALGGAQVSEKHAGFVINTGTASAKEVFALCREVQRIVKEQSGVDLELEVRTWGEF